ncbi:MAG TPA: ABC transporter permease [Longimicrobiales bacterium]|nr:ABC transporter permease [Longimicrobiales bacterium]
MDLIGRALAEAFGLIASFDAYVFEILLRSLQVSGTALALAVLVGLPYGVLLGVGRFPGRRLLVAVTYTGFALPPVVVGLFVYLLLSREGPAGALALLFSPTAIVVAQALLAAPYVAGVSLAAIQAVPPDVRLQARALGASRARALWAHLREARLGILAAVIAGFGAVISEVGAATMVGGNIVGETRVLTTAIVLETRRGNFETAMALGFILLAIVLAVNLLLTRVQQGPAWGRAVTERPWS